VLILYDFSSNISSYVINNRIASTDAIGILVGVTGRQKSKLAMLQAIEGVCSQYRHVWNHLSAFREAFGCFQKQLERITALANTQRRHTGGAAQEKVRVRERACVTAFEVAAALRAAASTATLPESAGKLAFSLTQLRTGKDALCLDRCRQILAAAQAGQVELQPFGVTLQRLQELSEAIEAFASAAQNTRSLRTANKSVTSELPAAFLAVESVLYNQLDNLLPQFQSSAPRFYKQYQENRIMKAPSAKIASIPVTETEEPTLLD
jgi:hypothetical protein